MFHVHILAVESRHQNVRTGNDWIEGKYGVEGLTWFNCRRMRAVNLYKEWTCILHAVVPSESLRFHLWWTWQGTCSISKSSTKKRLKKPQGAKTHQQSSTSTQFQAPISLSMFIQQHSVEKLMVESLVRPSQMSSWGPCKARKLVLQQYPTTWEYDGVWWNMMECGDRN